MADPEKAESKVQDDTEMASEEGEDEGAMDESSRKELVDQIMKDPQSLPKAMKRRIKALKKLQLEFTEMEADFYKEVHDLEVKYDSQHQRLYEKRRQILNAEVEPTDEECDFKLDDDAEDEEDKNLCNDLEKKAKVEGEEAEKPAAPAHGFDEETKGIPEFWLTVFRNVDLLAEMLQDHDEPILAHLTDIRIKFHDEPMGFSLDFHFSENEYFSNKVLTKYYEMKCKPDPEDPFRFEGPEIVKCKGCTIDWKQDKNVTVKVIKKKQKHKTRGAFRTVTKTVPRDSFFNFFNPPAVSDDVGEVIDEQLQALLTADFEIGHYIRERIVPRAVLFYTGEALDDEDLEEEEDGEEEEDEEEEDDPDYDPTKDKDGKQQDCKQQ
ncbi:nucleosome assembly protein 1-like 1 isoform X2 [Hyalella azteca]|uniref:Nucleosome assembly protein 1-like 1 isoform X2 n=1 Tax=Hyalella azteca TaxID=294128 RepID=A0A8B7PDK6_HYAAZ|nr:nucleosome assembly protein 1-like 1 isoform X2 [Hyalella azteca]